MSEINNDVFSVMERDAIGEILNISIGSSATAVSNMLGRRTDITTPSVDVVSFDDFNISSMEPAVAVEIEYIEGIEGNNILVLKKSDVKTILEILMMTEIPDEEFVFDEMSLSAVCELMNQMMGASSTALAELLSVKVDISPPQAYEVDDVADLKSKYFEDNQPVVVVRFDINIEDALNSEFLFVLPVKLAKHIISMFTMSEPEEEEIIPVLTPPIQPSVTPEPVQTAPPVQSTYAQQEPMVEQQQPMAQPQPQAMDMQYAQQPMQYAQPPMQYPQQPMQYPQQPMQYPQQPMQYAQQPAPKMIQVQSPPSNAFMELNPDLPKEQAKNLDMLMTVPLEVTVEIGRTKKLVKDIVSFTQGTLVVLDKLAGEQVDLYVNDQCIAKGDVVVVDDSFGVRITKILDKHEIFNMK